ncbi:MAG: DUF4149 domain-containing protein [Verrucomicrobiia bacterium]
MKSLHLFRWSTGLWLGAMLFFTFAITPSLFGSLDKEIAGNVVSLLFPNFYTACHIGFGLTLVAGLLALRGGARRVLAGLFLVFVAWSMGPLLNQLYLGPEMRALKAAGDQAGFSRLHGLSMILNLLSMILLLVAPLFPTTRPRAK